MPNYLWVPDKRTRKEFLKLVSKKYILDYGHPYYWEMNKKYKLIKRKSNRSEEIFLKKQVLKRK